MWNEHEKKISIHNTTMKCEETTKKKISNAIDWLSINRYSPHIYSIIMIIIFSFFYALNHNKQTNKKKTISIKRQFVEYIVNEKKKNGYIIVAQFTPISFVYIGQNYYYDDDVIWNHWPYIYFDQFWRKKRTRTKAILKWI